MECPNHILKATIQSKFCFLTQSTKRWCLQFVIFNFSEKLLYIFEMELKNILEKIYLERKHLQTFFCCLCTKLATAQIWGRANKFPLTCSFQKGPKRWLGCSDLKVLKNLTIHLFQNCDSQLKRCSEGIL